MTLTTPSKMRTSIWTLRAQHRLTSHARTFSKIGSGLSFAPQLALASYGARVTVAGPFLKRWDQNYHPEFYRQFRAKWDVLTLVPNFTEARV
jgi:hypothetical protein